MDFRRPLLILTLVAAFVWVLSPLFLPLAMGGVFATLFYPWQTKLVNKRVPPYIASALITVGVTVCFLLPMFFLAITGAKLGLERIGAWSVLRGVQAAVPSSGGFFENLVDSLLSKPSIEKVMNVVTDFFPLTGQDIANNLRDIARTVGVKVGAALAVLVTQLPSMLFAVMMMVVSIFFFMADGAKMARFVRQHSAFSHDQTERLIDAFSSMCRSVVLASVASGLAQGALFWLVCLAMGVPNAFFLGVLVFFTSFIPLIGSAPVTLLVSAHLLLVVDVKKGIVLLIGAGLVSVVDSLVRPAVLKGTGDLHPLLAFVAAFGGLQVFGVAGVFLGPVVVGVFLAMLEVMGQSWTTPKP